MKLIRNTFTGSTIFLLCLAPIITSGDDSSLKSIRKTMGQLPDPVTNEDYYEGGRPSSEKVDLGRLLFFDKILSGNQNISCATCHHPEHGTSDGVSLSFGEGALGLGPKRHPGANKSRAVHGRIPRNSPALFNLGSKEFSRLFHDGRVESDPNGYYEGGFITPAKWTLPKGLESVLAAQAMFPVASADEMAGQKGENPIADSASLNNAAGKGGVWELLAERLRRVPEYRLRFRNAFPEEIQKSEDITYVHAANAIAAFEGVAFRADNSPFDQFLRGDKQALSAKALSGMKLFYGKARCFNCHSGKFQTDHDFHAIAMAQVGPGKSDGQDSAYWRASGHRGFLEDFGRDFGFKSKSLFFDFYRLDYFTPESLVTGFHVGQIQIGEHVGNQGQQAVTHSVPEIEYPMWPVTLEPGAIYDIGLVLENWVQHDRVIPGIIFQIRVLNDYDIICRCGKSGFQCSPFAHVSVMVEHTHPFAVYFLFQQFPGTIGRTIIHDDDFPVRVGRVNNGLHNIFDRVGFVVTRDNDR